MMSTYAAFVQRLEETGHAFVLQAHVPMQEMCHGVSLQAPHVSSTDRRFLGGVLVI